MLKSPDAFRTISEVAEELDLPQHILRFWETRFSSIRPLKRGGGRRYYRPDDVDLLKGIRQLLYGQGYTIKGVQRILREQGLRSVQALGRGEHAPLPPSHDPADDEDDPGPDGAAVPPDDEAEEAGRFPDPADAREDGPPPGRLPDARLPDAIRPEPDAGRSRTGLAGDDLTRLRGVLDELLECQRILGSLQAD